jgi:hypothetical protein
LKADINTIRENPHNPRTITEEKFRKLVDSLRQFPEMLEARPIVVDKDNVVLGGNMRLKAAREAGLKEVPIYRSDWGHDKSSEFIIKDNVSYGEHDWDILANEWDSYPLAEWGLDVWTPEVEEEEPGNPYSTKVEAPIYKPTKAQPQVDELQGLGKYQEIIASIEGADLDPEIDSFLRMAATRHIVFDYEQIAEYYAHAPEQVQNLMEQSALVIVDFGQAIQDGFVRLNQELKEQYLEEHE